MTGSASVPLAPGDHNAYQVSVRGHRHGASPGTYHNDVQRSVIPKTVDHPVAARREARHSADVYRLTKESSPTRRAGRRQAQTTASSSHLVRTFAGGGAGVSSHREPATGLHQAAGSCWTLAVSWVHEEKCFE